MLACRIHEWFSYGFSERYLLGTIRSVSGLFLLVIGLILSVIGLFPVDIALVGLSVLPVFVLG